jgi:DHA1 family multidrug resistance protein-like MFS transporter
MSLKIANKGVFFIAVSQFGMAFSFHCIMAFMPFYIIKISTYGPTETMIWIGLIMGASNVVASVVAPIWGGLTSRFRPKLLFERGMLCNGILILLLGFTDNLYLLLFLRICQGALGGVSTIGLVLISSLSSKERIHKDFSLFQNAITAGQLVGPPIGAFAASLFGYRAPFVFAFIIVSIFIVFCHRNVTDIPLQKKWSDSEATSRKRLLFGWGLSFVATLHLTFLPSVLPNILAVFNETGDMALRSAGFIIMAYTGTAIVGNYFISRLVSRMGLKKVITLACLSAAFFQVLLILSRGVLSFMVIRMIQMFFVASIIPLMFSVFGRDVGGKTMGFLNSARFVGSAVAPIMATSVLAYSNLLALYILIAVLTIGSLWAFLNSTRKEASKLSSAFDLSQ